MSGSYHDEFGVCYCDWSDSDNDHDYYDDYYDDYCDKDFYFDSDYDPNNYHDRDRDHDNGHEHDYESANWYRRRGREPEDESRIENHTQGRELLSELVSQRKSGELLDIVVEVGGREFPCHRAVLASTRYFKTMLSSNLSESNSKVIQLCGIDSTSFCKILDFLYTGKIRIGKDDAQDILQAARMLQLDKIVHYCTLYVGGRSDSDNDYYDDDFYFDSDHSPDNYHDRDRDNGHEQESSNWFRRRDRQSEDGSRGFKNHARGRELLSELVSQRKSGELLDIVVDVEGREFPCHRAVLASTPYFKTMLSSNFAESSSRAIKLHEVDSTSFCKILEFMYTGKIRIGKDDVQNILQVAHMLQLDKIVQCCCGFIQDNLCLSNCLGVMRLADMYGFAALEKKARNMAVSNFLDVTQEEEFLSLPPQQLAYLLRDDHLKVTSEDDVVNSLIKWLDHAPETQQTEILKILQEIRLSCVRVSVLQKLKSHPVIRTSTEYLTMITAVREKHLLATQVEDTTGPRRGIPDNLAIIVGGWNANRRFTFKGDPPIMDTQWPTPMQRIICLDPDSEQYYDITTLPTPASGYMSVASAGRHLYVTGGRVHPLLGQGSHFDPSRQAFRYDFPSDTWLRLPHMPRGCAGHQSVVVDGKLFVVNATSSSAVTMGCYDPEKGTWIDSIHVRPPLHPSSKLAVTACGNKVVFILAEITVVYDRSNDIQKRADIQQSKLKSQGKLCCHAFDVKTKDWKYTDIETGAGSLFILVYKDVDILTTAVNNKLNIRTGYTQYSDLYIYDVEENTLAKGDGGDWKEDVLRPQCMREYRHSRLRQDVEGIVNTISYYKFGDNHSRRQTIEGHNIPTRQTLGSHHIPTRQTFGGHHIPIRQTFGGHHIPTRQTFGDPSIPTKQTPLPFALFGHTFLQTKKSRLGWYCRDLAALGKDG
ncbi:kelch-like protein 40 [Branchiostoma floridae x Branchiostoma belcheri]